MRRRTALRAAALVVWLPACQAIWGIDSLSGDGLCVPCYDGPSGTENVGACTSGCKDASGSCTGQVTPSTEVCATADVDENCDGIPTCTGDLGFQVAGLTGTSTLEYAAVAPDSAGGLWATGTTQNTLRIGDKVVNGPGSGAAYVAHLDATGKAVVLELLESDGISRGWGVAVLPSGDAVIAGEFAGTMPIGSGFLHSVGHGGFLAAFDGTTGKAKWARQFSGRQGTALGQLGDVAVGADGKITVCGSLDGKYVGPKGQTILTDDQDIVLARFDADGNEEWAQTFGGTGNQNCEWIAVDADGGIAMVGGYTSPAWRLGRTILRTSPDYYTPYLARLTKDGRPRWAWSFFGSQSGYVAGVGFDPATSDVIVAGDFTGEIDLGPGIRHSKGGRDIFIATFNDAGGPLTTKTFGDDSNQSVANMRVDGAGQIILTGEVDGTLDLDGCQVNSSGGPDPMELAHRGDAYVAKLATAGKAVWCKNGGTSGGEEYGLSVASDRFGVVAGGGFPTTFTFGDPTVLTCGTQCPSALYFARFAP